MFTEFCLGCVLDVHNKEIPRTTNHVICTDSKDFELLVICGVNSQRTIAAVIANMCDVRVNAVVGGEFHVVLVK